MLAVVPWLFPTQSLLLQQATQACSDGQASFQKNEQSLSRFQGLQSGTPLGPASCNSSPRSRAEDTASPLHRRGCEVPSESILRAPMGPLLQTVYHWALLSATVTLEPPVHPGVTLAPAKGCGLMATLTNGCLLCRAIVLGKNI